MRVTSLTIAALALLATGGAARAHDSGTPREHDGFFVQMNLGGGPMASSASSGGLEVELSGMGGPFALAIGAAVVPNLIVAGQFWGSGVGSPELKVNGQSQGKPSESAHTLTCVGVNVAYYFMPINVYVSATPSLGMLHVQAGGVNFPVKDGFAFRLAVGKEWWVSDSWGLGLNLQYARSSNKADATGADATWVTNSFGLVFSATYN